MANIYVRSTDGSNADNGTTWALAKLDLAGAAAIDAAGDTIYVSHNHAESTSGAITLAWAGTPASPTKIICGFDSAEPPTASTNSATVTITGASVALQFTGNIYCYGLKLINAGTSASGVWLHNNVRERQVWEQCSFQTTGGTGAIFINASSTTSGEVIWRNCTVKLFSSSSAGITTSGDAFVWDGGSFLSGTATPAALFTFGISRQAVAKVSGVDFSNLGTGFFFLKAGDSGKLILRNCKLPSGWTGGLHNGTMTAGARVEMWNCDTGDTNYKVRIKDYIAELFDETTLVKTGGASDGTTGYSWKVVTTSNANKHLGRFETPELYKWNDTTGSAITVTIDILRDSATSLTEHEIWIDVQYLGTSGFPLASFSSDASDILGSPANQTSSSATWTTTGMSNPNTQKLNVTFTPREKGYIIARVIVAAASTTVYIDPVIQVS